jgi:pyrimidine deaminase RibD-like protein
MEFETFRFSRSQTDPSQTYLYSVQRYGFTRIPINSALTMTSEPSHPTITAGDHKGYMEYALAKARLSPPTPTKFCVGAVLVDADKNEILSTGFSMELPGNNSADPGNTHAEQCCFIKVALKLGFPAENPEERIGDFLPQNTFLYTTMEPCNERLSGNKTCVERILTLGDKIKFVYVGIQEPGTFIDRNEGRRRLEEAGVRVELVEGMYDRILEVSLAGHENQNQRC